MSYLYLYLFYWLTPGRQRRTFGDWGLQLRCPTSTVKALKNCLLSLIRLKYEVERNLLVNECDVLNEELNILLSSAAALYIHHNVLRILATKDDT